MRSLTWRRPHTAYAASLSNLGSSWSALYLCRVSRYVLRVEPVTVCCRMRAIVLEPSPSVVFRALWTQHNTFQSLSAVFAGDLTCWTTHPTSKRLARLADKDRGGAASYLWGYSVRNWLSGDRFSWFHLSPSMKMTGQWTRLTTQLR
jgi:hypothetical protein